MVSSHEEKNCTDMLRLGVELAASIVLGTARRAPARTGRARS